MASPTEVVETLRLEILGLERPPGTPLREIALAERFSCSRRSVREALLHLHGEGLVVHQRNRGAVVRTFTAEDVRDLYRVREVLEVEGARSCAEASTSARESVRRGLDDLASAAGGAQDSVRHALADMQFHASVVGLADSPRLSACFSAISMEMAFAIRLLQRDEVTSDVTNEAVVAQHAAIAEPVLAGDAELAVRAVRQHVVHSRERLVAISAARW